MATGFLLVCLLAGVLVPRQPNTGSAVDARRAEVAVELAAREGARG
jgi:hypothetical protein